MAKFIEWCKTLALIIAGASVLIAWLVGVYAMIHFVIKYW